MSKKFIKYAYTDKKPVANHPAQYRGKKGQNEIEFVVFTHAEDIEIDGKRTKTIKLNHNVKEDSNKKNNKRDNMPSRVSPVVYSGERSLLGKNRKDIRIHQEDKKIVDKVFKKGKRKKI